MQKAFSLAELSIVLIIIGLLVVGVSYGSKLIESSKIHSVINEINEIETAITTFSLAYDSLPGDIINAEDFFGAAAVDNGNGDGEITVWKETNQAPFHMQAADLLTNYEIATDELGSNPDPQSFVSNFRYALIWLSHKNHQWSNYRYQSGTHNLLTLSLRKNRGNSPIFKPTQAMKIDKKLDNGLPKTGKITITNYDSETACTTGSGINYNKYLLSSNSFACTIAMRISE